MTVPTLDSVADIADRALMAADFATMDLWKPDPQRDAGDVLKEMEQRSFDAAPLNEHPVARYVTIEDLRGGRGPVADYSQVITAARIVPGSLGLVSTIRELRRESFLFVFGSSEVDGIVTRSDLQSHSVAVGVLALILAVEQGLQAAVERIAPDWKKLLSKERLDRAEKIFIQRQQQNTEIGLIDCLALEDLMTIAKKCPPLKERLGMPGGALNKWAERLRKGRDTLAHAGDLLSVFPDPAEATAFVDDLWEFTNRVLALRDEPR